jgi:surface-adhesin protein E
MSYRRIFMTRLLWVTLLALSCGPVYAEWVEVGGKVEEGLTIYLDLDTISSSRSGDVVKIWELWDFKRTRTEPKPPHMSVKYQREIDCTKKRARLLAMTAYSGNMGSGKVVYSYSDFKDQGIEVVPGSVSESVWKVACKQQ